MQPRSNKKRIFIVVAVVLFLVAILAIVSKITYRGGGGGQLVNYSGPGYSIDVPESFEAKVVDNSTGRLVLSSVEGDADGFIEIRSDLDESYSITEKRARQIANNLPNSEFKEEDSRNVLYSELFDDKTNELRLEWLFFYKFKRSSVLIKLSSNPEEKDFYKEVGNSFMLTNSAPEPS